MTDCLLGSLDYSRNFTQLWQTAIVHGDSSGARMLEGRYWHGSPLAWVLLWPWLVMHGMRVIQAMPARRSLPYDIFCLSKEVL